MENFFALHAVTIAGWIAVLSTLSLLSLFTFGSDEFDNAGIDIDGCDGADCPSFFSYRTGLIFMCVSSWVTFSGETMGVTPWITMLVSIGAGLLGASASFFLLRSMLKLQQDNNFDPDELLNKECKVIVALPAENLGKGKVQLTIHDTLRTYSAASNDKAYPTGATVYVLSVNAERTLLVTDFETPPINPPVDNPTI